MKTIKPQKLGLLHKTYENGGEYFFTATLLTFFPFEPVGALLSEVDLWKFVGQELGKDVMLDMCMPKARGELLLCARAHQPGGVARPVCNVRAELGRINKTLYLFGDRYWEPGGVFSEPVLFSEMAITWENAFGGPTYASNPLGKGYEPVKGEAGRIHRLPNVEDPKKLVRSPRDSVSPAGFGPYDFTWPQRFSKAGTHDQRWLKERFPGFAEDMDWSIFNAAPEDQQIDGFFDGNEVFVLENLHRERPTIKGELPAVATRCFVNRHTTEGETFQELDTRLDTVWLFPHAERGILVFRATTRVVEEDASDVLQILVGCEDLGAPKSTGHYESVFCQRMDRKKGYLYALRDSELMPRPCSKAGLPAQQNTDMDALIATEDLLGKNLRRKAEREREQAREQLVAMGLDPDEHMPPPPPEEEISEDPEQLATIVEEAEARLELHATEAETKRAEAEQAARQVCEEHGLDYDKVIGESPGGPPRFAADEQLEKLRSLCFSARNAGSPVPDLEAMVADPAFVARLRSAEEHLRQTYISYAHHFPPAKEMASAEASRVREDVSERLRRGEGFSELDLTGADLSQMDLSGGDLRGVFLERANLAGANLSKADLSGAVLARADLSGADLSGAQLVGSNLGESILPNAVFDGANLTGAVLWKADVTNANFRGATMDRVDLTEAILSDVDFRGATAPEVVFLKSNLKGARFRGANLSKAIFLEVQAASVDFSEATLESAVFVTAQGRGANFRKARLTNLRIVKESCFSDAIFSGTQMDGANLRGTDLRESDFSQASLCGADLSECNLHGARFYRALANKALFIKSDLGGAELVSTNLMQALLRSARLHGTNFLGANLFRADLTKARIDAATNFKDAILDQACTMATKKDHGSK